MHQADLLFLPHDKLPRGKKVYKYALTVVVVASRYKAAEALASKDSDEVARGFAKIYKKGPLKWPQLLQVDPGREFMGAVTKMANEHNVTIRPNIHRDQAIVERFNRTLAERLFGYQYAMEMNMPSGRSTAWVKRLPEVVSALNNEVTRLIGKKPADAIREKAISSKPATPYMRPVGVNERKLPPQVCTTPANWRVEGSVRLIRSGHSRSTMFTKLSPNRMNPWCTTCLTDPSGGLFARS